MYHGAESTDGGHGTSVWNHFWAKAAGWIVVPLAASLATRVVAPVVIKQSDDVSKQAETLQTLSAVCHALGAAGSWYASGHLFEDSPSAQAFLRGGMWSEVISTAFLAGAPSLSKSMDAPLSPPVAAVVKGLDAKSSLDSMLAVLTGGISKELAQPRPYVRQLPR